MKIFLAQQNYRIGDLKGNSEKIIHGITQAKSAGADLVVFSELSLCGYPIRDILEYENFINQCEATIDVIKQYSQDIGIILGAPSRNKNPHGKNLHNSAFFLHQGEIQHISHKTCLPTYDIFDEYRYFEPCFSWETIKFKGKKIALTICEDIWSIDNGNLYRICPMDKLMAEDPDLMINISASPFDYDQKEKRLDIIQTNVEKYNLPMFYCNTVGTQTEIGFDGGSIIMDNEGNIRKELPYFEEAIAGIDTDLLKKHKKDPDQIQRLRAQPNKQKPLYPATGNLPLFTEEQFAQLPYDPERNIDRIHHALIQGIRDYFEKLGFEKAILGSSGGIDSAVTIALACEALGAKNVYSILLPSSYSTNHSVEDAEQLSRNLGTPYDIIPIKHIYNSFLDTLKPQFSNLPFDTAEENIQARSRGNILMALANKLGYILLNTSNKSELSVGYGTLYGDLAGGLSILGDLYKTQIYSLAKYINRDKELIPQNIIDKNPSAELRPEQKDSDSLPDYEILDAILYEHIEHGLGEKDIVATDNFDRDTIRRTLQLFYSGEYKRHQFCPILRVSGKAFGSGRRAPIVRKYPG